MQVSLAFLAHSVSIILFLKRKARHTHKKTSHAMFLQNWHSNMIPGVAAYTEYLTTVISLLSASSSAVIVATCGIMMNVSKLQKMKHSSLKYFTVILVNNTTISAAGSGVTLGLLMSIKDIMLLLSDIIC